MDSAGHGISEPKTKLFPEVTVTGRLPTHPSSFNHDNFDPELSVSLGRFAQMCAHKTFGHIPVVPNGVLITL